jgi:RHS repeat-associated protein
MIRRLFGVFFLVYVIMTGLIFAGEQPDSNGHLLPKNQMSYSDINLTQGTVEFSEVDIEIPGINGMNIVVARNYNSRQYQSNADISLSSSKTYGPGFGFGWSLNVLERAFFVDARENNRVYSNLTISSLITGGSNSLTDRYREKDKVYIESGGAVTVYGYDVQTQGFRSKVPGNKNIPVVTENGIYLDVPGGKRYYFELPIYEEFHKKDGAIVMKITGYYLTRIVDAFRNEIRYSYEGGDIEDVKEWSKSSENKSKGVSRVIGGATYDWLSGIYGDTVASSYYVKKKLNRIENAVGVGVTLKWEDSILKSVQYIDDNYKEQQVLYSYDTERKLIGVSVAGIEKNRYEYAYHKTQFVGIREKYSSCWDFGGNCIAYSFFGYDAHRMYGNSIPQSFLDGYLLKGVVSQIGTKVEYAYQESLEGETRSLKIYHATYPVVISKEIKSTGVAVSDVYRYTFNFPLNSKGRLYNVKSSYKPDYIEDDIKLYYFNTVSVDKYVNNVAISLSEKYVFENALLVSKTNGDFVSKSVWDLTKNLKMADETYKFNIKESRIVYEYDANRNITKRDFYKESEGAPFTKEEFTYCNAGDFETPLLDNLVKTKKVSVGSESRVQNFEYTSKGFVKKQKQTMSNEGDFITDYEYDDKGRITEMSSSASGGKELVINYSYVTGNNAETNKVNIIYTKANGKTISSYSNFHTGRVFSQIDANGQEVESSFDSWGRPLVIRYPNNRFIQYSYSADFKKTTTQECVLGGGITICRPAVTSVLDDFGRISVIDRPDGVEDSHYTYYFGQALKAEYKGDASTNTWELVKSYAYDTYLRNISVTHDDWGTTRTVYDDAKRTVSQFDVINRESRIEKNSLGQVVKSTALYTGDSYDQSFTYNAWGNQSSFTDTMGVVHYKSHNTYGQLNVIYQPNSPTKKWQELSYFANNQVKNTRIYDENEQLFAEYGYVYDVEDRLTEFKLNGELKEWLSYDDSDYNNGLGNLTTAENEHVKSEYEFDNMGRIIEERTTIKDIYKEIVIKTGYTAFGQVESVEFGDKNKVLYNYDNLSRLSAINYTGTQQASIVAYEYDRSKGRVSSMSLGANLKVTYAYDDKGMVLSKIVTKKDGTVLYEQRYSYNSYGLLTKTENTHPIKGVLTNRAYTYSQQDELMATVVDGDSNKQYAYSYDKLNNMTIYTVAEEEKPVTVAMNYSIKNELLEQKYPDDRRIDTAYDAEGKLIRKTKYTQGKVVREDKYRYNYQGQIEEVTRDGNHLATYYYNHKRERVYSDTSSDLANAVVEKWYYNNGAGQIIGEGSFEQEYEVRYIYSGNEKVAMIRPDKNGVEKVYYFINNMQGTPVFITDAEGVIESRIQMDEWGNVGGFNISSLYEVNYTGKKLDSDTGLYYFNQRYYDPELGRFLTHDPARQTVNAYMYAGNNPLMFVDPDGEWFWAIAKFVGAFIKNAMQEALKNVASQWVTNGFDGSKINWEAAGNAGLGGGIIKGLGLDTLKPFDDSSVLGRIGNESFQGGLNQVVGGSVSGQHMTWENSWGMFSQGAAQGAALGAIREVHWGRNVFNDVPKQEPVKDFNWKLLTKPKDNLHQYGVLEERNMKYISRYGFKEAVYQGNKLITNINNIGTFNFIPINVPLIGYPGHMVVDVIPYYIWGNGYGDTTTIKQRIGASL